MGAAAGITCPPAEPSPFAARPPVVRLQVRLWQLGKLLPARLAEHLESLAVVPVLYASAWLLTCFGSDFPIAFAARVLDVVITDCYAAPMMKVRLRCAACAVTGALQLSACMQRAQQDSRLAPLWGSPCNAAMPRTLGALAQVAVGIMEHCSELLLEMGDMELILQHLKQDVPKWPKPVLQVGPGWAAKGAKGAKRGCRWGRGGSGHAQE